jgi:hypothetical protein
MFSRNRTLYGKVRRFEQHAQGIADRDIGIDHQNFRFGHSREFILSHQLSALTGGKQSIEHVMRLRVSRCKAIGKMQEV